MKRVWCLLLNQSSFMFLDMKKSLVAKLLAGSCTDIIIDLDAKYRLESLEAQDPDHQNINKMHTYNAAP